MSEELRLCPFCGEMPKANNWTFKGITETRCFCDNENCPVYLSKTIAIDDWNTRPLEDALRARIAELEEENDRLQSGWFRDETICPDGSLRPKVSDLLNRIAELEAENNRLAKLLHNVLSSLEIATDLGNKRWVALNDIYKNGEKHNANWCKRKAQEGLGVK